MLYRHGNLAQYWSHPACRAAKRCLRFGAYLSIAMVSALVYLRPVPVFGQAESASIVGVVTDQSDAVIPEAKVTVRSLGTGSERQATTDSRGGYTITLLPVGSYSVVAEKQGFNTVTIPQVTLAAGDSLRENIQLGVGQLTQTVQVTAQAAALQSESATVGTLINPTATEQLPLNGRNFQGLEILVPGTSPGMQNGLDSGTRADDRRLITAVSVNDQPEIQNNFLLDGMDDNERFIGSIIVKPQIDGLSEIKIETDNYEASVTRTSGGVVSLISKSGTDQFHGSVYEFVRNTHLDARNFFDTTLPPYHQNQFGGSLGGPIQKGKMFFFGDYEGLRIAQSLTYLTTVPTAVELNGNFAGIAHVFNPFTAVPDPSNPSIVIRQEYNYGGALDNLPPTSACEGPGQGCIDPISSALNALWPTPNPGGATALANNFLSNPIKTQREDSIDARIDHVFSAKDTFFGRYSLNDVYTVTPSPFPMKDGIFPGGGSASAGYGQSPERQQNVLLNWVHLFSPTAILEAKASWMRMFIKNITPNSCKSLDAQFGITGSNQNCNTAGLTVISISGFNSLGDNDYLPFFTNCEFRKF